jgi:transcription elongation factor Elf1
MGYTMPTVVKCERCGRLAVVEEWEPVYDDPLPTDTIHTALRIKEFSYKIRCSKCGIRIQVMPPPKV